MCECGCVLCVCMCVAVWWKAEESHCDNESSLSPQGACHLGDVPWEGALVPFTCAFGRLARSRALFCSGPGLTSFSCFCWWRKQVGTHKKFDQKIQGKQKEMSKRNTQVVSPCTPP